MYGVVTSVLKPYPFLFICLGLGIVLLWRTSTASRRLRCFLSLAYSLLFVISTPLFSHFALGLLEWQYPPRGNSGAAKPILVLAGSIYTPHDARLLPVLGESTLHRCLKAARVYAEEGPRRILLSGGSANRGPVKALEMRQFLLHQGVDPAHLLVEEQSRNTYESALRSRDLLGDLGSNQIMLITDAAHLFRAQKCFEKQGFEVEPVGCRYRATRLQRKLSTFLPSPAAALDVQEAFHELAGIAWYWMLGRF